MHRPRLVPRQAALRKQPNNETSVKLIADANGDCCTEPATAAPSSPAATITITTSTTGDETLASPDNSNNQNNYFSPLLVHEKDDDHLLVLDDSSSNNNNSLNPITLQYWNDNPHMQSFDLLGVIENNSDQDQQNDYKTMPSTCFARLPIASTTTHSNASGAHSMINMLLTSPRDTAHHYRDQAARMWEEYYSVPNSHTTTVLAGNTLAELILDSSNASTKQLPLALRDKLEDKSPLLKTFVLMEQQREMQRFLHSQSILLNNFVSRGEELSHQQQRVLCSATSSSDSGSVPVDNNDFIDTNNNNGTFLHLKKCKDFVPNIFFNADFSLSDPITYDSILSLLQKNTPETNNDPSHTTTTTIDNNNNYPLLSDQTTSSFHLYWDSVDATLREQVVCRSEDFFLENATFRELEILVAHANVDVTCLRQEIHHFKASLDDDDSVPIMAHQRMCLQQLYSVLEHVTNIVHSMYLVEKMMVTTTETTPDYQKAYNLASQTMIEIDKERTMCSTSTLKGSSSNNNCYRLVDLAVIAEIRQKLCDFQSCAVVNATSILVETFISWEFSCYQAVNQFTRSTIKNLIDFLSSIHQCSLVNQSYTHRLSEMVYVTVKATVMECAIDSSMKPSNNEKSIRKTATATNKNHRKLHHNTTPQDSEHTHSNYDNDNNSLSLGLVGMATHDFFECLQMVFEQITALLKCSFLVVEFLDKEGITLIDTNNHTRGNSCATSNVIDDSKTSHTQYHSSVANTTALYAASELSQSLISDIFTMRKEAFSFIKFEEIKYLWRSCSKFASDIEELVVGVASGANILRISLFTCAKVFVEQHHVSNMARLAACLENEKWVPCAISAERQDGITKLCGQEATDAETVYKEDTIDGKLQRKDLYEFEIGGTNYKVVWSCLYLIEVVISDLEHASFFHSISVMVAKKITELLRLFNTRAKQMVLGARALRSGAQLQSINTKHLALVTQCIDFVTAAMPYIQSEIVRVFPVCHSDSETADTIAFVIEEFTKVRREYDAHREMIFEKFVTVIKAVVQHSLAPQIAHADFDKRALQFSSEIGSEKSGASVQICPFLEGILTNATMMHHVLSSMLPDTQLQDIFLRIFTYIDQQVPILFVMAAQATAPSDSKVNNAAAESVSKGSAAQKKKAFGFSFPKKRNGMRRMIEEIIWTTAKLNQLSGVNPYAFTMASILGRKMGAVKNTISSSAQETSDVVNKSFDNKS